MRAHRQQFWPSPTRPPTAEEASINRRAPLAEVLTPRFRPRKRLALGAAAVLAVIVVSIAGVSLLTRPAEARSDALTQFEQRQLIASAQVSTVRVGARACPGVIRGSGFVIGELLFTAGHLVVHDDQLRVESPGQPVLAPIVGASSQIDIAVARADDLLAVPLTMATMTPPEQEVVFIAGYPDGRELQTSPATIARYSSASEWGLPGQQLMLLQADIRDGFSGGPVLNREGDVVGILIGRDQTTGLAVAIPADELASVVELAARTWSVEGNGRTATHAAVPCSK